MDGVFYWVLNMSILGLAAAALVFLLRFIPRFPRFALYCLWGVAGLRFAVPFAFESSFSLMGLLKGLGMRSVTVMQAGPVELTMTNYVQAAQTYFPVTYKEDALASLFAAAAIAWAAVAALLLLAAAILYIANSRRFRNCTYAGGYCVCAAVRSPAVSGIFRPKVLIPTALAASPDLKYILAHERVHVKRRDNLWRLIAVLVACVHWFNPLVWLFVKAFIADSEAACDVKALSLLPSSELKNYARALVANAARPGFAAAFGANPVKARVLNILTYKKMTAFSACAFALLTAAVVLALLSNPQ